MEKYKIYSAGKFIETNQILDVKNPFNKEIFAQTYLAGEKEFEDSVNAAIEAKQLMKEMPSYKKYEILRYVSDAFYKEKERLATVLSMESGKPMRYAIGEIERSAQTVLIAAEESKRIPKEYFSLDWTAAGKGKEALVKHFPIGLVGAIAPFNFPLNLAMHKVAPAIAAGNTVILKPARSTPLSVLEFAKIIDQTDLPKGVLSVLPADRVVGNKIVTDTRFDMLSFTGSPEVGWEMKRNAGKKKIALELGGNAGVIVSEKADIEKAVSKCLVGAYAYSGQVCIHVQRIYVQKDIFDFFVKKFIEGTKLLKQGNPLDSSTEISVMIDEQNAVRVESWVNEAVSGGAKILFGGKRDGNYFEPTIITNTKPEMNVCFSEIFGPVVTIEKYETLENAVKMVNDSQYGLQAGIFSDSNKEINYAFENINVGGVISNDIPTFRVDHMPYGGVKNSGFGREGIKYTILEMTEARLLVRDF
jgi:glyceraldehyde-3-phosphate dehydrogenase (NADP+)